MKKYTLDQFKLEFENKRHICCGINYIDGDHDTAMNASLPQILSYIKIKNKEVLYIITRK